MKVKEAIEIINRADHCYSLQDAQDLLKGCPFIDRTKYSGYKWYIIATDIYRVEDGFIGVRGISDLKTRMLDFSDCNIHCEAEEYKVVNTRSYVPVNSYESSN